MGWGEQRETAREEECERRRVVGMTLVLTYDCACAACEAPAAGGTVAPASTTVASSSLRMLAVMRTPPCSSASAGQVAP